jgi:ABC-type antimicrobial peptide transport system permease subunit
MAIGAQAGDIARRVAAEALATVLAGAVAGLALGMASVPSIETLLYQVQPRAFAMIAFPLVIILATAFVAALPAVVRAVRIDPVTTLRSE